MNCDIREIDKENIRERLDHDLKVIVDEILLSLPQDPDTILLCGGYGRDEGAWFYDTNGNIQPYNDYDLSIITDNSISYNELQHLKKKLANILGIQWIDIDFYPSNYFDNMKPTIKNIDLLYASKLLYGQKHKWPSMQADRIGIYDVVLLYQTRMWTFLGSWNGNFHDLDLSESRFFNNQMAKAVLAACDMHLIQHRAYTPLYSDRVEWICEHLSQKKDLCELSKWALQEKLYPGDELVKRDVMESRYFVVKNLFLNAFWEAMAFRANFFLWPQLSKLYFSLTSLYLPRVVYNHIIRKSNKIEKTMDIFIAQNYVFLANSKAGVKDVYLKKASQILKKWGYICEAESDWDILRILVSQARNNI